MLGMGHIYVGNIQYLLFNKIMKFHFNRAKDDGYYLIIAASRLLAQSILLHEMYYLCVVALQKENRLELKLETDTSHFGRSMWKSHNKETKKKHFPCFHRITLHPIRTL